MNSILGFRFLALLTCLGIYLPVHADHNNQAPFSVSHYQISLDLDFAKEQVKGSTEVTITPRNSALNEIQLSLLSYNIDSINSPKLGPITYQYDDTTVKLDFSNAIQPGDTAAVTVYYQGDPPVDPTGWGGFYFREGFAFNLGVGFGAKPHNFGRAWFPCLDNFTDRATYDFYINTPSDKKAYCNGRLINTKDQNNGRKTWHWRLKDPIPTYLASVAAGPYTSVKSQYKGVSDTFPLLYAVQASDSNQMKKGFRNMNEALDVFIDFYGPQPFSRVGYAVIPFQGGAMEHATNIAYPQSSLTQALKDQRLWAHELSHHWWGDLTTTHRAEEMWLNEGWATFSEFLFLDHVYGDSVYREAVRDNHYQVLTQAHERDETYRPLVPVPHDFTYGVHSYNKGGDVINTLRHYLGDSSFKHGIRHFIRERAFKPMTSKGLRDTLEAVTGQSLQAFFDQWVFSPGYPHFSLRDLNIEQSGNQYEVSGTVHQQKHQAPDYFRDVKLPVTGFYNAKAPPETKSIEASGEKTSFNIRYNKKPNYLIVDPYGEVADAKSIAHEKISGTGTYELKNAELQITVDSFPESFSLIAERHFEGPCKTAGIQKGYELSDERYWRIEGAQLAKSVVNTTLRYDTTANPDGLNPDDPKDLVILHRNHQGGQWQVYDDFEASFLGANGRFTLQNLQPGEYCFGKPAESTGRDNQRQQDEKNNGQGQLELYPQPAKDQVNLRLKGNQVSLKAITILTIEGKVLKKASEGEKNHPYQIHTGNLPPGSYLIKVVDKNNQAFTSQLVVKR